MSPDGRWIAVTTLGVSYDLFRRGIPPEELPQPRVHLIEVATGIRETLIVPQGAGAVLSFSHDGKTLATSGQGKVFLFDLAKPRELPEFAQAQ